ncbi:MAG: proprotein convertase P-domain-containing protein [Deltaproteobacteria bacterium]|nr:proprotein convertase P-domain-containing protein [Deltaproteobacteria bacterium]
MRLSKAMTLSLVLSACGGESDKPKLEAGDELEQTEFAVERSGSFTELQSLESAHPYADDHVQAWEVRGSADTTKMRVVLDRFELEEGYDVLVVSNGATRTTLTGLKTGREVELDGNVLKLELRTDGSITKWGFRLKILEAKPCVCPMVFQPVCGADGRQYSNGCAASCAGATIDYAGPCRGDWFRVDRGIASLHPYANDTDFEWEVGEGGATRMRLHFTSIDLERGYDKLEVRDAQGRVVVEYTGKQADVTTPAISGSLAKIRLVTDSSVTKYGFAMDFYEVVGGCASAADCGPGQTCLQPQCIRAPCFSMCVADQPVIQDVSVADLLTNGAAYSGRVVRVSAEPTARSPVCTRIACSPSNPCCNRCSSSFSIGEEIMLTTPGGEPMGCSGNECTVTAACEPFAARENGPYELTGRFELDASGGRRLYLDSFRAAACHTTGCSGQVCANSDRITTCEFRDEYMCYRSASCEPQTDGHCGFTPTPTLDQCLAGGRDFAVQAVDTPITIPDADPTGIRSIISVPDRGPAGVVRVSAELRHSYRGDLRVVLTAPDGTEVVLHERQGGSNDDLVIVDRVLDGFTGRPTAGNWTLKVADLDRVDTGTLTSFGLVFAAR